jgi:putative ATP-dependent endonuclease of OLD family
LTVDAKHLMAVTPKAEFDLATLTSALSQYFAWGKGSGQTADLLASCTSWQEMPKYITDCLHTIFRVIEPSPPQPPAHPSEPAAA